MVERRTEPDLEQVGEEGRLGPGNQWVTWGTCFLPPAHACFSFGWNPAVRADHVGQRPQKDLDDFPRGVLAYKNEKLEPALAREAT